MESLGQAGDIDRLYRESRPALFSYFARRHRAGHAAEDLLHETFLRLIRKTARLRSARSPRAYLFGIARHVSADAFRRAGRAEKESGIEADSTAAAAPDPRLDAVRELLAGLPPLQREILDLRFQHDLSYEEIAEALNIPVGTVRSRLHNAMRMLRERFAREDETIERSPP